MVGSTALSQQLDPEELGELIREYQRACADVIRNYDGHVAQYLGDGLLAHFGYPSAHEDDPQRAVRAGLAIVTAVHRLSESNPRIARPLKVRIGIHTGLAVIGNLQGSRGETAIVGETPNVAARLQSIAEPDTVVISAATHRLVRGFFECRSLGGQALKGLATPIEAFLVVSETGIQTRFESAVRAGLTPFVGRESEIALLLRLWTQVKNESAQVVLLCGEPGIGKSRLIRELKENTQHEPHNEIECRCSPYYQSTSLYPVIDWLQRLLRFGRDDSPREKLARLEEAITRADLPPAEAMPLLATLLSLPSDDRYPAPALTPQQRKQRTQEILLAWLLNQAHQRPTLVVIEDLHWADPSTLELLRLLMDRASSARLMMVVAYRADFAPAWVSGPHVTSLTLGRLDWKCSEQIIEQLANRKRMPLEVTRQIAAKTDGVPLFIEELTRMVLESGLLHEQSDHYALTRSPLSLEIPSTLSDSLMARLDRLGKAKEAAQVAATIGRDFSYDLLRAVSPLGESELRAALDRLIEAELIYRRGSSSPPHYFFKHALIQDAAYQSLLRSTRRQYHREIALLLSRSFPQVVETQPELVAHHYTGAGMIEQALPHWQRAGERAIERSAHEEAIAHLSGAIDLLKSLPEGPDRLRWELVLHTALGAPLIATRGYASPEVERAYARARELCQQIGDAPQLFPILWGLWVFYTGRANHPAARELGEQCLRLAEKTGDPALLLEAHHAVGVTFSALAEFELAIEHLEWVIVHHDPERDARLPFIYGQHPKVVCLSQQAWTLWVHGYPERGLKKNNEALALARAVNHPHSLAAALGFGAVVHQFLRDAPSVERLSEMAAALSGAQEFEWWRQWSSLLRGWAQSQKGRSSDGIERMRESLTAFRANGSEVMTPYFFGLIAEALLDADRVAEARDILAEARAVVEKGREVWWEAELYRLEGELSIKQSGPDIVRGEAEKRAEERFLGALAIAGYQKAKSLELRAATSLASLWSGQGKIVEARRRLRGAYDWFTEGHESADLCKARQLLDMLGG